MVPCTVQGRGVGPSALYPAARGVGPSTLPCSDMPELHDPHWMGYHKVQLQSPFPGNNQRRKGEVTLCLSPPLRSLDSNDVPL